MKRLRTAAKEASALLVVVLAYGVMALAAVGFVAAVIQINGVAVGIAGLVFFAALGLYAMSS